MTKIIPHLWYPKQAEAGRSRPVLPRAERALGQRDQIKRIERAARKIGATITIVLDIVHVLECLWECCRRKHTPHRLLVGPEVVVVDLVDASLSALRLALLPAPLTSISKDQIMWPVQKVAGSAPGRRDASQIAQLRGALESSEIFRYVLR